ncbi:MAG: N-acetyltransferase family protein [Bdellovibrionales bacterium]
MPIQIEKATTEDVDRILNLIRELAEYERAPDKAVASREDLLRDGFRSNPMFHCVLGKFNGRVEGFALYFFTWSTWTGRPTLYLEDLYVRESARGHGLGFALLKKLAAEAVEAGCARMEWAVLDWNQPARDFYHRIGAFHKEDWLPYRIEGEALLTLAESK